MFTIGKKIEKPKMFQWTRRIQFLRSRRKFLAKSQKIIKNYFFSKKLSSKCSSGHVEMTYKNTNFWVILYLL